MNKTTKTLTNTQMMLMIEDVMRACEDRAEEDAWDDTVREVYVACHKAWRSLVSAYDYSKPSGTATPPFYTHPDSNAFISWD